MAVARPNPLARRFKAASRKARELATVGHALLSTKHVVMAQIVPARFCNLSCAYCNEYDKVSEPVPIDEMLRRIDHLARLGTSIITISGGEPLTHPDLDQVIARIRHHGRIAGMITNGYLLMPERIERLNKAGLDHMQISIDNVQPDEISKKSLKVLDKKLEFLVAVCRFSREHQLGRRRRDQESAGCADHRPSRAGTRIHLDHRHHSRWRRPVEAAAG